jgi:seryl-tRNA synthetase
MIDPKILRDEFDSVRERLATRGLPDNIDLWPALDKKRRELITEIESIKANKNKLGPELAKAKREGKDISEITSQLKKTGETEKALTEELNSAEAKLQEIELLIPNLPHSSVPVGKDEKANRVEKEWGKKPEFKFTPKPHWEVGEALGILDFETAVRLSGARFALYRGDGARLERALINFMLDRHREVGYTEIMPPALVLEETMRGSGQLPKFKDQLFRISNDDREMYLIPTSEVPLCNLHAGQILDGNELPLYYTAYTPCFRAEAGSHGRDVRGLIRLHQFNKVELVKITSQETSYEELEKLTRDAEGVLEALGLAYRRLTLCTGDMGMAAAKTHDLEVWLPGQGEYREISSCSNTDDFQGRRTNTRYRWEQGEKTKFAHMLNGSGLAVGRTVVAILENFQQEDGSVIIPEVLRKYLGGQEKIKAN